MKHLAAALAQDNTASGRWRERENSNFDENDGTQKLCGARRQYFPREGKHQNVVGRERHVTDNERVRRSHNGEVRLLRRNLYSFRDVGMTVGKRSRKREEIALSK